SHADLPYFERRLRERMAELGSEIDRTTRRHQEPRARIAGEAPDSVDSSMATVTIETESAQLEMYETELRRVDAALGRICAGSYAICPRCGQPIERVRLEANPAAERHARCQEDHDRELKLARTPPDES